jgi:hypothetical protein
MASKMTVKEKGVGGPLKPGDVVVVGQIGEVWKKGKIIGYIYPSKRFVGHLVRVYEIDSRGKVVVHKTTGRNSASGFSTAWHIMPPLQKEKVRKKKKNEQGDI